MHISLLNKFYFINNFKKEELNKLPKNTSVIFRNYQVKYSEKIINDIKKFCLSKKLKFYLSNDIKLANKLNLDWIYIPAFNNDISSYRAKFKNMKILGSAHNIKEVLIKKKQLVDIIFLSPVFKTSKSQHNLGIVKFNLLSKLANTKTVILGGINKTNLNFFKSTKCNSFASISYINKLLK